MLCFLFVLCFQIQLQREVVNGKNPKCAASHIFFSSFVSHYSPIITSSVNGCDALLLSLLCISFNLFTAIIGADNWLFPLCSSTPFYRIYFPRTYLTNPKKTEILSKLKMAQLPSLSFSKVSTRNFLFQRLHWKSEVGEKVIVLFVGFLLTG